MRTLLGPSKRGSSGQQVQTATGTVKSFFLQSDVVKKKSACVTADALPNETEEEEEAAITNSGYGRRPVVERLCNYNHPSQ